MQVSFPGLGIEMNIDRVAFELFGIDVYWYGIIIAFAFMMGIFAAGIAARKLGESSDIALDIALVCAPVAIICARLYYVIFKWESYVDDILSVFDLRSGGLAIYGGIIGAVLTALIFCKVKKKNVMKVLDIGSVGLITGQMIGRWGNFFNQEAFGSNTDLPWGMTSQRVKDYLSALVSDGVDVNPDIPVHPTFLYESLWSLMTLALLFVIIYKFYRYNGQVFFAYVALYGLGRFWIEGLRTDSLMIGMFRVSQLIALCCFVVCGFLYFWFMKKHKSELTSELCECASQADKQSEGVDE